MNELQTTIKPDDFIMHVNIDEVRARLPGKIRGPKGQVNAISVSECDDRPSEIIRLGYPVTPSHGPLMHRWLTMSDLCEWTVDLPFTVSEDYPRTALIETIYAIDSLPKKDATVLVRHSGGAYGVFNPTLQVGENTGVLWSLKDNQHHLLPDLDATDWQLVGLKATLAQALYQWSGAGRNTSALFGSLVPAALSGMMGVQLAVAGAPLGATFMAVVGASFPTFVMLAKGERRRNGIKKIQAITASYQAPDAVPAAAIESSLADRFDAVIAQRRSSYPAACLVHLAKLPLAGHHILKNLSSLDARTQQEATTLLLDNLPKALQLHEKIQTTALSEQVRTTADERLSRHLQLISDRVESLVMAVDTALATEQDEFGYYLDSKLRTSELDR